MNKVVGIFFVEALFFIAAISSEDNATYTKDLAVIKSSKSGEIGVNGIVRKKISNKIFIVFDISFTNLSNNITIQPNPILQEQDGIYWPNFQIDVTTKNVSISKVAPFILPNESEALWVPIIKYNINFDQNNVIILNTKYIFNPPLLTKSQIDEIASRYKIFKARSSHAFDDEANLLMSWTFLWALQDPKYGMPAFLSFDKFVQFDGVNAESYQLLRNLYEKAKHTDSHHETLSEKN